MTRPMTVAAILLGFALGGMFDAIVVHLILQWHHLASGRIDPATMEGLRANLVLDGLFLIAMLALATAAVGWIWREGPRHARPAPGRILAGATLIGWGAFHFFDTIVTHSLLELHHVHPGPELLADLAFLTIGVAMIAGGWWLLRSSGLRPRRAS